MTTLAISIDKILEQIYALSALRKLQLSSVKETPLLHKDHRDLLAECVEGELHRLVVTFMPRIADYSYPELPVEGAVAEIVLRSDIPAEAHGGQLVKIIENYVAYSVLALAIENDDPAEGARLTARASLLAQTLSTLLDLTTLPRIHPCR